MNGCNTKRAVSPEAMEVERRIDMIVASQRCVILAVDATPDLEKSVALVQTTMDGPIGPHVLALKLNDVLHAGFARAVIEAVRKKWPDLILFPDLKLADVAATDVNTVARYNELGNLLVTVSLHAPPKAFVALREKFPDLRVAAMGVPTDWTPQECLERYGMYPDEAMWRWSSSTIEQCCELTHDTLFKPFGYAITSEDMLDMMRERFPSVRRITPGVRDEWMDLGGQKRVVPVGDALKGGAWAVVIGSQLTRGNLKAGISVEKSQRMTAEAIQAAIAV